MATAVALALGLAARGEAASSEGAPAPTAYHYDTPVTPGASARAQGLLAYLGDIYGKKILSGQQDGAEWEGQPEHELNLLRQTTGKLPVIRAFEMGNYTLPVAARRVKLMVIPRASDWYTKSNGIVALCWHWRTPTTHRGIYVEETAFDLRKGLKEGTREHAAVISDLDTMAGELKRLRDAGVPVLWRPLHEANGRWFWWGAQGPQACRQLWRLMFKRFTQYHKLNNLIWVFSPGSATDLAEWYPGDAYVDIIGQDHYPPDGNRAPAKDVFEQLVAFGRGNKLVGFTENGPIPDVDRLVSERAGWLSFVNWSGRTLPQFNSEEQLRAGYNHPYVLTLGQLPDLKKHPFPGQASR